MSEVTSYEKQFTPKNLFLPTTWQSSRGPYYCPFPPPLFFHFLQVVWSIANLSVFMSSTGPYYCPFFPFSFFSFLISGLKYRKFIFFMSNSIIGENDCERTISHETNPSPIKWWLWKGNCPARVMDSVSAVMTHVMRESWDPGPGPYRRSSCKAPLGAPSGWMAKGWPAAPPSLRAAGLNTESPETPST